MVGWKTTNPPYQKIPNTYKVPEAQAAWEYPIPIPHSPFPIHQLQIHIKLVPPNKPINDYNSPDFIFFVMINMPQIIQINYRSTL